MMNKYKSIIFLLLVCSYNSMHGMRRPRRQKYALLITIPAFIAATFIGSVLIKKTIFPFFQWYSQESDEKAIERIRKLTIELLPQSDLYSFIKDIKIINDETVKPISDYIIASKNIQNIHDYLINLTATIQTLENNLQDLIVRLKNIATTEHKHNYAILAKLAQQLKNLISRLKAIETFFENPQNKAAVVLSTVNTLTRRYFQQEIEIIQTTSTPKKISFLLVNSILFKQSSLTYPLVDAIKGIDIFITSIQKNSNELKNHKDRFNQLLLNSQELLISLIKIKESIITDIRYQQEKLHQEHAQEILKRLDAIQEFMKELKKKEERIENAIAINKLFSSKI